MCDFLKLHVDRQNSGMSCCSYYNDKELKQSDAFSLLICLDDIKFVLLSFFSEIETIWLTIWAKPSSKNEKRHFQLTCVAQKRPHLSASGHLRHDYLIKYAYFYKMLFRTVCFYQWSWKLNYKCSLMALAIWVHFRSSNFRHVTDNWELTIKIFTLKWGKDNKRATSSFTYISEAIKKVLINSPCMCDYVI